MATPEVIKKRQNLVYCVSNHGHDHFLTHCHDSFQKSCWATSMSKPSTLSLRLRQASEPKSESEEHKFDFTISVIYF